MSGAFKREVNNTIIGNYNKKGRYVYIMKVFFMYFYYAILSKHDITCCIIGNVYRNSISLCSSHYLMYQYGVHHNNLDIIFVIALIKAEKKAHSHF